MGSFLYTTNEKFSEGMVNFKPVAESCGHIARGLELGGSRSFEKVGTSGENRTSFGQFGQSQGSL